MAAASAARLLPFGRGEHAVAVRIGPVEAGERAFAQLIAGQEALLAEHAHTAHAAAHSSPRPSADASTHGHGAMTALATHAGSAALLAPGGAGGIEFGAATEPLRSASRRSNMRSAACARR